MWDWEIKEWMRNRPPIPSKGPIPLECFRTVADLCAHTAELSRAYFAALEQEARRVTPATERFRRGDRVNKAYGGKLSEDADDDEQQGGHDEDINSVIRRTREAEKMAKAHGRKAADTAVDALPDGPGDGLGAQLSVRERAIDLRRRGKVLASRGELLRACACFDAAIALPHDDVGNRERAVALVNRSAALQRRGRLEEALADARHAAQLDERSAAKALLAAAEAERALGRFRAAVRTCDRAMSKATPTERESEGLRALRAFCAREAEHAAPQLEAAAAEVRAAQESGDTTAEATALAKLGDLLRQQGDFGTAQEALEALLSLAVSAGDAAGESSACGALAAVCDAAGDDDAADEYRSRFVKLGFESARALQRALGGAADFGGDAAKRIEVAQRQAMEAAAKGRRAEAVAMVDAAEAEAQAEARQRAARANIEARIGDAAAKALAPEGAPVTIVLPRSVMAPPVDDEVD